MIPYSRQNVTLEDIKEVNKVLKSNFLTQGPTVSIFERKIAKIVSAKYGVATNSATSALHVACLALGLNKNDYLWTTAISFVASANCGLYCNAKVKFIDIDSNTFNISIKELEKNLVEAKKNKKLPKIVVPVHLAGNPVDQEKIFKLSKKFGFKIIEDASHALGAFRNNEPVGSCKWSHIAVFSFHPVKIITTGEGGIAVTNNKYLSRKMKMFSEHGITKVSSEFKKKMPGYWYYEQQELGYNYRMSDIHAALGISQLKRLTKDNKIRNKIAKIYIESLKNLPVKFQEIPKENFSSYHLLIIWINDGAIKKKHKKLFQALRDNNILVNIHYIPIYKHPYHSKNNNKNNFPISEQYYKSAISLPLFPQLKSYQQKKVIKIIRNAF
jgi:UDP-4-amino-4,6-dideoxy-N-acetyl-beta-L-altrosamine transaminase